MFDVSTPVALIQIAKENLKERVNTVEIHTVATDWIKVANIEEYGLADISVITKRGSRTILYLDSKSVDGVRVTLTADIDAAALGGI